MGNLRNRSLEVSIPSSVTFYILRRCIRILHVHGIPPNTRGIAYSSIWYENIQKWVAEEQTREIDESPTKSSSGTKANENGSGGAYGFCDFLSGVGYAILNSGRGFW